MTGDPRTADEIEALVVDRYLESLLSRRPIDTSGVPPELEWTARRLTGALPRFHPSFRFEEALAGRLASVARAHQQAEGVGSVVAFPRRSDRIGATPATSVPGSPVATTVLGRPALIGGVLTSAALSVAGAAYVAWRRSRPADEAMARAIRAVARARTA